MCFPVIERRKLLDVELAKAKIMGMKSPHVISHRKTILIGCACVSTGCNRGRYLKFAITALIQQ